MFEAIFDAQSGCVYLPELQVLAVAVDGDALAQGTLLDLGPTPWDRILEAQARFSAQDLVVMICGEDAELPENLARQFDSALVLSRAGTRTLSKNGILFSWEFTTVQPSISPSEQGEFFEVPGLVHLPRI